ncbi:MAG TPA: glycosyltransferase family A protein [Phenylobacterium sp.]|nr:glycosyltransferase family A protein [Phenylobacterium sp.]
MTATVIRNARWADAAPTLSVLTPFKGDDPTPLLAALAQEAGVAAELVLLDDGSGDAALAARVEAGILASPLPACFIRLERNEGRSKGRNRLAAMARGRHLLFLDSDMLPDSHRFLARYAELIEREDPAVVFGGFSVHQAPERPDHALHRAMALRSDCLPASARSLDPGKHVFTSNLLVRRDVFEAEAFDEGFSGWGWEDVEWGVRVARRWPVLHIDNTATHLGLDTARTIAAKYEQSAGNFARILATHPEAVTRYPTYRAARMLKRAPLRGVWRPVLKALATADLGPVAPRAFAMRLYRAALYADAV